MRVLNLRYDIEEDGTQLLQIVLDGNCEEECRKAETIVDHNGELQVYFSKGKRSLESNSLYWTLVTKIAHSLGTSLNEVHNTLLRRYGVPMLMEDSMVYAFIPDTEEAERSTLMSETYHLKPTSNVKPGKGDTDYRAYVIMKGSSQMTTEEMSALIDGAISECKEMGIEYRKPWEVWG